MNVVRLEGDILWTRSASVEHLYLGKLAGAEIKDGFDLYTSTGAKYHLEPELYESEAEVKKAYDIIYPNGKPKPEPEPSKTIITEDEKALDFAKYIMSSPDILLKLGIVTR